MKAVFLLMIAAGVALGLWFAPGEPGPVAVAPSAPALVLTPQTRAPTAAATSPSRPAGETVLERQPNGHFYASAAINGRPVNFMVDTGASGIALSIADAQAAGIAVDPSRFDVVGTGAGGAVRGQRVRIDELSVEGRSGGAQDAVVIDGLAVSLLGQSYLRTLDTVAISGDRMVLR